MINFKILVMNYSEVFKVPGKVLMSGGYGVLQHLNIGLSLAVDVCFFSTYSVVASQQLRIIVHSPQTSSSWSYLHRNFQLIEEGQNNKYLLHSIRTVFNYFKGKHISPQQVTIYLLFQDGFLSCTSQSSILGFSEYKKNQTKQGLGSSACVVVSVIRIMCELFGSKDLGLINYLSHIANLSAQGKIGSNFDISSAIYGSQLYTNILPKYAIQYIKSNGENAQIFQIANNVQKINLSDKFQILLLDEKKGSNTVKMVSGFLSKLQKQPQNIIKEFYSQSRDITYRLFSLLTQEKVNKDEFKKLNHRHRQLQQKYGQITEIEIEPRELKQKLDRLMGNQEVLYVICPGSGGYDSVSILKQKQATLDVDVCYLRLDINCSGMCNGTKEQTERVMKFIKGHCFQQKTL